MPRRKLSGALGLLASVPGVPITAGLNPLLGQVSPLDWTGFDPTGTHDNASIFRQLGAQVPAGGGVIVFPPGQIATSAGCALPSLTTVTGAGDATQIIALPTFPEWSAAPRALFINRAWNSGGGETGISIRNLRMTGPAGAAWNDAHFIDFVGVSRVHVDRVSSVGWGNCTALTTCQNTEVSNCTAEQVSNCGYDHWGGTGWARVTNSFVSVAAGPAGSFGLMATGINTDGTPNTTARVIFTGNEIEILGGTSQTLLGSCIEINAGENTGAATVIDAILANNICMVTRDATHRGIHLAQSVIGAQVRGNTLRGGRFGPAITATGRNFTGAAQDCLIADNLILDWTVNPSQTAPIAWWGTNSTVSNNRGRGCSTPFVAPGFDPSNLVSNNIAA